MGDKSANSFKTTRKYKTKRHWPPNEEKLLIKAWKERVRELKNARKNRHVYEEIQELLEKKGCHAEVEEIKTKVHNLTTRYRREKAACTSVGSASDWHLFNAMDKLLGGFVLNDVEDMMGEISTCLDGSSQQSASEHSEDIDSYEYVNENAYDKEGEAAATTFECNDPEFINSKYLESINTNMVSLVERINELSERMLSMEESGNAILAKLLNVLRNHNTHNNCETPEKRVKLSVDGIADQIFNFESTELHNEEHIDKEVKVSATKSFPSLRNTAILEDYLKTKQLEREFMSEKHKIQIEILKLELEAKRKEALE